MAPFNPIKKLISAARGIPEDDRVPYAFEHRVMARIHALRAIDPLAWWGQSLSRAAALCVLVMILLTAAAFLFPAKPRTVSLPEAVQSALLATVDSGLDQIETTP